MSTVARGYGKAHRELRDTWQRQFDGGHSIPCACRRGTCPQHDGQCPVIIDKTINWDLGHTDDRRDWTGPECVPCNRSAGGRNSRAALTKPMTIRAWCEPPKNPGSST